MNLQNFAARAFSATRPSNSCAVLLAFSSLAWTGCGSGVHGLDSSEALPLAVSAGPQLGYVWRSSDATLRPILGIPGSSQIGAPVTAAGLYVNGVATPYGQIALLVGSDGSVYRKQLPDGTANALNAVIGADALIRFSPSGKQAVVYSPASGQALKIGDVSGTTAPQRLALPQGAVDITVSDAGAIAVATGGGGSGQAAFIDGNSQSHRIVSFGQFGGFRFMAGIDDLLLVDAAANTLTRVHAATTAPTSETLQSSSLLHSPVAVAATTNGQWALVSNKDGDAVVRIGIASSSAQSFACDCSPTAADPVLGGNAFRITDRTDLPVWIMDLSGPQPRLTFVPALSSVTPAASTSKPDAGTVQP